jgi:hypothetical protein
MGRNTTDRDRTAGARESVSRRTFLSKGAVGVGAVALTGVAAQQAQAQIKWDRTADVVASRDEEAVAAYGPGEHRVPWWR